MLLSFYLYQIVHVLLTYKVVLVLRIVLLLIIIPLGVNIILDPINLAINGLFKIFLLRIINFLYIQSQHIHIMSTNLIKLTFVISFLIGLYFPLILYFFNSLINSFGLWKITKLINSTN